MEDYYLGLDIGTNSIGWAVTDTDYKLKKFNGKSMWGSRLLPEQETAAERRSYRAARRNRQRQVFRLECLEGIFAKEIAKKDQAFFQRLRESDLYLKDKTVKAKYPLFNDKEYTDKDYHRDYPTIYHLRLALLEENNIKDPRLLYLAVAHLLKNRGHFLYESDFKMENSGSKFKSLMGGLLVFCNENYETIFTPDVDYEELENILNSKKINKTTKKKKAGEILGINPRKNKQEGAIIGLICGSSVPVKELFLDDKYSEATECKSVALSGNFDENEPLYSSALQDDYDLVARAKEVYDSIILSQIMQGSSSISEAKVKLYEKHQSDILALKKCVRKYVPEKYKLIFHENNSSENNYLAYSKHHDKGTSELKSNCTQEDFCKYVLGKLPKEASVEYAELFEDLENGVFAPKQKTKDNSVIPIQLTKQELRKILQNAQKNFEFLDDETVEKIISIHEFRVPYYVGPLNNKSDKSWVVRTSEKIYPWNFSEVVDEKACREKFITNLTSKCSYLPKEDVLPKQSLIYQSFEVLQDLNNIRIDINGKNAFTNELKQEVYKNLYLTHKKVTTRQIVTYLKREYKEVFENISVNSVRGIDGDPKGSLSSYRDFENISITNTENLYKDIDDIIKTVTIFGQEKAILKKRLQEEYGNKISAEDIDRISRFKYTGWGKLSKKFLCGITSKVKGLDRELTIMEALWETQNNLMQLLSKDFEYSKKIADENNDIKYESLKEEINSLYLPPKVKRPTYQTVKIVDEIVRCVGYEPAKIFIETTHSDGEKGKRTNSRSARINMLLEECKKKANEINNLDQLENEFEKERNNLSSDALYLYFLQLGKDMYSGRPIDIEQLSTEYNIDHIYPRQKIKDDSLDNRVLTHKRINEDKTNNYPLDKETRDKCTPFWAQLLRLGLMSAEKYHRLTRTAPLDKADINKFINRQIVDTSWSAKAVRDVLERRYKSRIVPVKAQMAHDLRYPKNKDVTYVRFPKCRSVNDLHHAKDAYLNIVAGNVFDVRFNPENREVFVHLLMLDRGKNSDNATKSKSRASMNWIFNYPIEGAWNPEKHTAIMERMMSRNDALLTYYSFTKKGQLFDLQPKKKGEGQVSIKGKSIEDYGGYNSAKTTYFALVYYKTTKQKEIYRFVSIKSVYEKKYIKNPEQYIKAYLMSEVKNDIDFDSVRIIQKQVKIGQVVEKNGFRYIVRSEHDADRLAIAPFIPLVLNRNEEVLICWAARYVKKFNSLNLKNNEIVKPLVANEKEKIKELDHLFLKLIEKMELSPFCEVFNKEHTKLIEMKDVFLRELDIIDKCKVIEQILFIFSSGAINGSLSEWGGGNNLGRIVISKKITESNKTESFKLINQSVTGLFETEKVLI